MPWKNWLVHRLHDGALRRALSQNARGLLLDVGCGAKPLERLTRGRVARHVGVDHPQSPHGMGAVDAAAEAYRLPFRDGTFDCLLCTVVLEHLEEPLAGLREFFRVLKPGGAALITAPFIWHVHEAPRDFYRYSRHGLEYLLRKSGFGSVEVKALSGFWVTFGQLLVYNLYRGHRGPMRLFPVIPALGMIIQILALGLDSLDRSEEWTWAYLAVGKRGGS